jgi:hypothetical protein
MKPTLDSIKAAHSAATDINTYSLFAVVHLAQAATALECTSALRSAKILHEAREHLKKLRRKQTAALRNIDEALKTL